MEYNEEYEISGKTRFTVTKYTMLFSIDRSLNGRRSDAKKILFYKNSLLFILSYSTTYSKHIRDRGVHLYVSSRRYSNFSRSESFHLPYAGIFVENREFPFLQLQGALFIKCGAGTDSASVIFDRWLRFINIGVPGNASESVGMHAARRICGEQVIQRADGETRAKKIQWRRSYRV